MTPPLRTLAAVASLVAASAGAQVVYQNDFQGGSTANLTVTGGTPTILATPGDCSGAFCGNYLGYTRTSNGGVVPLENNTVTLTLNGLGAHTSLSLGFSFFALSSWDGNAGGVGPDVFMLTGPGGLTLANTTFSNVGGNNQTYPGLAGSGNFAAQTGATEVNKMGGALSYFGSAVYDFRGANAFTVAHTGSSATFTFDVSGTQGWSDEGWGLDNLSVTASGAPTTTTPEPATITLVAAGALGLVVMRRRGESA